MARGGSHRRTIRVSSTAWWQVFGTTLQPEEARRSIWTVTGGFKMRSFLSSMTAAALAAVLVIVSAAGLAAQSSTGNLRGTVKDAQGVIPGATVTALNEANGTSRKTLSNESGEYSFPALDPATYSVKVAVPGFRTFERKGVRVNTQAQ